jgi:GH43 family beta-xylosidase
VCYSTAPSAIGPWTYQGKILGTDENHAGPGHHCFVQNPISKRWYILYHRWNNGIASGKMPPTRTVAVEVVNYDEHGRIMPVVMTQEGVDAAPLVPC